LKDTNPKDNIFEGKGTGMLRKKGKQR